MVINLDQGLLHVTVLEDNWYRDCSVIARRWERIPHPAARVYRLAWLWGA